MSVERLLIDFFIFLLAASVGGRIAKQFKQPSVVGALIAKLRVGASAFGIRIAQIPGHRTRTAGFSGASLTAPSSSARVFLLGLYAAPHVLLSVSRRISALAYIIGDPNSIDCDRTRIISNRCKSVDIWRSSPEMAFSAV